MQFAEHPADPWATGSCSCAAIRAMLCVGRWLLPVRGLSPKSIAHSFRLITGSVLCSTYSGMLANHGLWE